MGDLSEHFNVAEFRCHGTGIPGHRPHPTIVSSVLVQRLEALRALKGGRPLKIVSGHRCSWWNRKVGGAGGSRHKRGQAADLVEGYCTVDEAAAAGFTGIGRKGEWAVHVDVRPRPARWSY